MNKKVSNTEKRLCNTDKRFCKETVLKKTNGGNKKKKQKIKI